MIAGVLGIILGSLGVHQWYLGDQKRAKRHLTLFIAGVVLLVVGLVLRALMPSMSQVALRTTIGNLATVLRVVAWIMIIADIVWGAIEGALLLVQGDAVPGQQNSQSAAPGSADPAGQNSQSSAASSNNTDGSSGQAPQVTPSITDQASQAAPNVANQTPQATPIPVNQAPQGGPATVMGAPVANPSDALVFKSSDIQNPMSVPRPDQAVGTKDVAAPALTVTDQSGKEKMNPVVKRWVLSGVVLAVAVVALGLIIKMGFDAVISSAYGETYRAAKVIKPTVDQMHQSPACEYAVQYAKSAYVDRKTYDGYIDTCKSLTEENITEAIEKLGTTPMLRWNSEISREYQTFQEAYVVAFPEETNFAPALQLYQTWHNYVLATDLLTVESEDVAFQEAADILRTSGNSTLAQYGELWLEKELEYIHAFRNYQNTSYTDPNKEALRQNYELLRADLQNWVSDHRPDVLELEKIKLPNTDAMYESFTKMYDLIRTGYEKHYDKKSGDCNYSGRTVYCN